MSGVRRAPRARGRRAGAARGRRGGRPAIACALAALCLGSTGAHPAARSDLAPPTAPLSPSGSALSDTEIVVAWFPPLLPPGGPAHYVVYRDGVAIGTSTVTSFTDTGLQPSTKYQYRISAVDGAGAEGPRSSTVNVTTMAGSGGSDTTPPTAPAGLQADAVTPTQIDLVWQAAADAESGVAHYRVYRDGAFVATTSGTTFSDVSVQPQTTYTYEVSAVNGDGLEGARSPSASATTPAPPPAPDTTPPSVPAGLEAEPATSRQIDLAWEDASDPESGIALYNVYRGGALVTSTAATVLSDSGLEPATTYVYQVSATNGEGLEGPRSAPAQATTPPEVDTTPPAAPGRPRIIG